MSRMPGPGDSITWPPYSGHPNDPRGTAWEDLTEEEAEALRKVIDDEAMDRAADKFEDF